jgi:riboflavin biosynthesis pyrimidine reductase
MGTDGSTSLHGSSEGISSAADRKRFLARRRESDCLIIGGNTARADRYAKTPVPLVILSRSRPELLAINPAAHWWNISPADAIIRAQRDFGEKILVEAGISILSELLSLGLIDQLELSVTAVQGGDNRLTADELLHRFQNVRRTRIDDTIFYSCTDPIMSQK